MGVFKAIEERRSIRRYKEDAIEPEKLNRVLEAARLAPSANNRQNWKFIVVRDPKLIEKMVDACAGQSFVAQAPVIIVACGRDPEGMMRCNQPRHTVDVSIAVSFLMLEAWEQGLGTCWLGSFYQDDVKKLLNIPDDYKVVAITPLGYPDESPQWRGRKSPGEVISYDSF